MHRYTSLLPRPHGLIAAILKRWSPRDVPVQDWSLANAALAAYVHTFPVPERLSIYLNGHVAEPGRRSIEAAVIDIIRATESFLFDQRAGLRWTAAFQDSLFEHMRRRHSWLARESLPTLVRYGQWLTWHEGLGAQRDGPGGAINPQPDQ